MTQVEKQRIVVIDILRGIAMVVMALDHTRDFFHADVLFHDPLDPATTHPALYLTRWITHFCAPTFVFLSGTSIYLQSLRKTSSSLSVFLFTRGLWLIFAEITLVTFALTFNPLFNFLGLQVIWAIGFSMIVLGFFILLRAPYWVYLAIGSIIVFGHNAFDSLELQPDFSPSLFWKIMHLGFVIHPISESFSIFFIYPAPVWAGVMLLGYAAGKLFDSPNNATSRTRFFSIAGTVLLLFFLVLRATNFYGNPQPWVIGDSVAQTLYSFFNVNKYPPSLLYLSATLGGLFLALSAIERFQQSLLPYLTPFETFGRTAFFYYLIHFYVIHLLSAAAFFLQGHTLQESIELAPKTFFLLTTTPYGFSLGVVYLVWMAVVAGLYPLCKRYDAYKTSHREKVWLSYL
ncbi:MAG: heparan-alpha-glucosaminide N-acetyltransferase domain-containing protein [Chloroherpetonaceae bacterium]|nr:heparan-alpha-glucosaminide N-acetyltransferase domain-containing protein [Chloroherpetonaceae bacterium]